MHDPCYTPYNGAKHGAYTMQKRQLRRLIEIKMYLTRKRVGGATAYELANYLGCSHSTVTRLLLKHGWTQEIHFDCVKHRTGKNKRVFRMMTENEIPLKGWI